MTARAMPDEVETAVLEEALVLRRQVGVDHQLGDHVDRHEDAPLARVLGDQRAVVRMNTRHHGRLVAGQALVARQILRGLPEQVAADRGARQEQHDAGCEQNAEQAQDPAAPPLLWPSRGRRRNDRRRSHAAQQRPFGTIFFFTLCAGCRSSTPGCTLARNMAAQRPDTLKDGQNGGNDQCIQTSIGLSPISSIQRRAGRRAKYSLTAAAMASAMRRCHSREASSFSSSALLM